jgi:hypothetical protein
VKDEIPRQTAPNWRINKKNIVGESNSQLLEGGSVNFSAGWFGQGHSVSFKSFSRYEIHFISA